MQCPGSALSPDSNTGAASLQLADTVTSIERPAVAASSAICTASSSGGRPARAASAQDEELVEHTHDTVPSEDAADDLHGVPRGPGAHDDRLVELDGDRGASDGGELARGRLAPLPLAPGRDVFPAWRLAPGRGLGRPTCS